jgi:hypothetical protein
MDPSSNSTSLVANREFRSRLRRWWIRFLEASRNSADQKADDLLKSNLSATQRLKYETDGCFDVIGGDTGTHYRIRCGYQMNVEQLDAVGKRVRLLCFVPKHPLPMADIMLAQKLALELSESEVLAIANYRELGTFF